MHKTAVLVSESIEADLLSGCPGSGTVEAWGIRRGAGNPCHRSQCAFAPAERAIGIARPLEPSQGRLAEVEGWGQGRAGGATIEKNGENTERDIQGAVLCAIRTRRRSRVPHAGFTDEGRDHAAVERYGRGRS